MAFVPGYKHDIFVSYAHVDDNPIVGTDKGWVTYLVENLQFLLSASLGHTDAYSLWMDRYLLGNEPFTETIQSNVRQSATLLIVLSPGYLQSEWCRREENAFLEGLRSRMHEEGTIFVIEMEPVDRKSLPAIFADELGQPLLGYRFWDEHCSGVPTTLGLPVPAPKDEQYFKMLHELARDIVAALKALAESITPEEPEEPQIAARKAEEVTPDYIDLPADVRQKLDEKLKKGEYDVFLCHNAEDKEEVKKIGRLIMARELLPWLDDWDMRPGMLWQDVLEEKIENIRSAAVLVGESGFGPWQNMELMAFIRQFVKRKCPVIPVLLTKCGTSPALPVFLSGLHYVDFRSDSDEALVRLIWGITGKPPPLAGRF